MGQEKGDVTAVARDLKSDPKSNQPNDALVARASVDGARALPVDGRQSPIALEIARGASRCLIAHSFTPLPEFTLPHGRRADLIALGRDGGLWIIEIKSSVEDFRVDQKWPDYRAYCDQFFFAVAPEFPTEILPEDAGLIIANRYGGEMIRAAPEHKIAPARRKAVTLAIARVANARLHGLFDPEFRLEAL
jgi:hypothetical protein